MLQNIAVEVDLDEFRSRVHYLASLGLPEGNVAHELIFVLGIERFQSQGSNLAKDTKINWGWSFFGGVRPTLPGVFLALSSPTLDSVT